MGKQLALSVGGSITSLPQRLVDLATAVGTVQHEGQSVRHNLPAGMAMSAEDRAEATRLLSTLTSDLSPNAPFEGEDGLMAKGALLTKMIHGLAGAANQSEVAATSKIEMYADAVDDLPAWAIDKAIKRWGRGSCPTEIEPHPRFSFPPSPAALRALSTLELHLPRRLKTMLENLLVAVPTADAMNPQSPKAFGVGPALRRM